MVEKKVVALSSICIVLVICTIATGVKFNQKNIELQLKTDQLFQIENDKNTLEFRVSNLESEVNTLDAQNNELKSQVEEFQIEKDSFESNLSNLELEISSLQFEKASLDNDKITLQAQIIDLNSDIETLNNEKTLLESQVSSLQTQVSTLEIEVTESYNTGFDEGEAEGYLEGVIDGAGSGYTIRNPTYDEVMVFVDSDRTDENEYVAGEYVCWNFVADFEANAYQEGYNVAFVYVVFPESAHAIVCFNTTDRGLVFIEPQEDLIVTLTIGEPYWDRTLFNPLYDDTVVRYTIIW